MPTATPDPTSRPRHILVATPGFETALAAELPASADVSFPAEAPGIVIASAFEWDASSLDPIFARQQLPAAWEIHAPSVSGLADAAYDHVEGAVDAAKGPFTIHAFAATGAAPGLGSRATLIAGELLTRLRARRRRASRGYQQPEVAAATFSAVALVIQILIADRDRIWISAAKPQPLSRGGFSIAPFVGGVAPVADDRLPPSRAYRKLEEAYLWMGAEPRKGELCIDLGGAPGGWSYTALRRGARVIAVDRAPLEKPVRGHPRLTMIAGNAFTYEPPTDVIPIDWLLSDVICEPKRTLALCARWVSAGWCRRLVVTVKFKGQDGYGILSDVRAVLERANPTHLRIKHLHHNKNEVTVMAAFPISGRATTAPAIASGSSRRAPTKTRRPG